MGMIQIFKVIDQYTVFNDIESSFYIPSEIHVIDPLEDFRLIRILSYDDYGKFFLEIKYCRMIWWILTLMRIYIYIHM